MARKLIKEVESVKRHNHIYKVNLEDVPAFIRDCLTLDNINSVETLDCHNSFLRQRRDDLSNKEVLDIIYESNHKFFSFILRKGYFHKFGNSYFEFCASGMKDGVEYFLWIEIEEESGFKLVEKYKLKKNDEL